MIAVSTVTGTKPRAVRTSGGNTSLSPSTKTAARITHVMSAMPNMRIT